MALSVGVALVLTPALCATLLKRRSRPHATRGPIGWFNRNFDWARTRYRSGVTWAIARTGRMVGIYAAALAALVVLFLLLPASFLPDEDQGVLFTLVQLPPGATIERTQKVLAEVSEHFKKGETAVASVFTVAGYSFAGPGQNAGMAFVNLKDYDQRPSPHDTPQAIAQRAMGVFMQIRDAFAFAITPPPVFALGNATGFDLELEDQGGLGHERLMAARNQLLGMASQDPLLAGVRPNGEDDTPQFKIDVDQAKAGALGLTIADINSALGAALGGTYVDNFVDRGRVKRVFVQADAPFRMTPEDLNKWYVRNNQGQMVPFSAFATTDWTVGSPRLERYNGVPSVEVQGAPAPGKSTGQAMAEVKRLVARLPPGIGYEWTGLSLQEQEAGSQAPSLYALSIVVVFLLLAALYESWSIPLAVILVIPLGIVGALLATMLRGLSNDVYFQVGLLTTMGLCAKNAILIVEFAREAQKAGQPLLEATIEGARIRLRPIIMTSMAFVFGVLPLAISTGAGSGGQHAIGTGVIGGMLAAIAMGIFFTPFFFVLVQRRFGGARQVSAIPADPAPQGEAP
jgi:multidrug efflux pump